MLYFYPILHEIAPFFELNNGLFGGSTGLPRDRRNERSWPIWSGDRGSWSHLRLWLYRGIWLLFWDGWPSLRKHDFFTAHLVVGTIWSTHSRPLSLQNIRGSALIANHWRRGAKWMFPSSQPSSLSPSLCSMSTIGGETRVGWWK